MAGNANPIFTRVGDIQWPSTALTAANTAMDGTGTVYTAFTADATNGGYVKSIRFKLAVRTGSSTATVARVFINNGSDNTVAANNILFDELSLPATTGADNASTPTFEMPLGIALPPGYKLNITLGTASSNGWYVSVQGGKY